MNGTLAALIALCMHGNAWLTRGEGPAPELGVDNSAFRYVGALRFEAPGKWRTTKVSTGTAAWLQQLRADGVDRIWLIVPPSDPTASVLLDAHLASAFANGGQWALMTTGRGSVLWRASWQVGDRSAPDQRIWGVTVSGERLPHVDPPPAPDLARSRAELVTALQQIHQLAAAHALDPWRTVFAQALAATDDPHPVSTYGIDLADAGGLSLDARQLLAGATQAWVFGGMGSWNDVRLGDGADSRALWDVTRQLYAALLRTFLAVANSQSTLQDESEARRSR